MDLRQLAYFVAVAEEGQFTRAAARESVAQPAVSAQIRRLERELGEALFHREPRTVALTDAGAALLPHARAALEAAARGRDTIASLRGMLHGRLRVGLSRPVDRSVAGLIGRFHREHPAIDISVSEQFNEPLVEGVAGGELDVAYVGMGGQAFPPGVRTRIVARDPLVVGMPGDHALAARRTLTIAQLRDEPLVTLVHGSGLRRALDDASAAAGFVPRIVAETGDLGSVVDLVAAGLGVALLPRAAAGDLTVRELTRPRLTRRLALAWNAQPSPAARAFLELAGR